jgi:hypothetical protein
VASVFELVWLAITLTEVPEPSAVIVWGSAPVTVVRSSPR